MLNRQFKPHHYVACGSLVQNVEYPIYIGITFSEKVLSSVSLTIRSPSPYHYTASSRDLGIPILSPDHKEIRLAKMRCATQILQGKDVTVFKQVSSVGNMIDLNRPNRGLAIQYPGRISPKFSQSFQEISRIKSTSRPLPFLPHPFHLIINPPSISHDTTQTPPKDQELTHTCRIWGPQNGASKKFCLLRYEAV
jgi:hypothetical protein